MQWFRIKTFVWIVAMMMALNITAILYMLQPLINQPIFFLNFIFLAIEIHLAIIFMLILNKIEKDEVNTQLKQMELILKDVRKKKKE